MTTLVERLLLPRSSGAYLLVWSDIHGNDSWMAFRYEDSATKEDALVEAQVEYYKLLDDEELKVASIAEVIASTDYY